jgi:hypothetical protein
VLAASGSGHDVVDVLSGVAAVLAAVPVTGEDGASGERYPVSVRDPDEVHQPDHGRDRDDRPLRVQLGAVPSHDLGLVLEDQDDRPSYRDDTERLEAGVEQQGSPQAS